MAQPIRQTTTITPEDMGPQDVFAINDINLVVPPSQITISKEDLVYRWRTLRTNSSTKIPTGHGRVDVHMTIYFTQRQLFALQRLIVQFKHSPFCYVDNRFLRESIVPAWPTWQNMAFTMTGLGISPMPGSSDTWVVELDMVWFNYFPYAHNWLYRKDWITNWIYQSGNETESIFEAYTIGWNLNKENYERIHMQQAVSQSLQHGSPSLLAEASAVESANALSAGLVPGTLHDEYSSVLAGYKDKGAQTLYDMEIAHAGVEWDMVPLPDNMQQSAIVAQPKHSNIYVRYINLLQRDALYKNFGIDVEADLRVAGKLIKDDEEYYVRAFFNRIIEDDVSHVWGLHTYKVPRHVRAEWMKTMLQHNSGVKFHYHALKEITFPQDWVDKASKVQTDALADLAASMRNILARQNATLNNNTAGQEGGSELAIPVFGVPFLLGNGYGPREPVNTKKTKSGKQQQSSRNHLGLDISAGSGTPILAPESGTIAFAGPQNKHDLGEGFGNNIKLITESGARWTFAHLSSFQVGQTPWGGKEYVAKGSVIGYVGTTGSSTNYHLHLEYRAPYSKVQSDPAPILRYLLDSEQPSFGTSISEPPADGVVTDLAVEEKAVLVQTTSDELEIDVDSANALAELMAMLEAEGWRYIDRDSSVLNMWEKLFSLTVSHSGLNIANGGHESEVFLQEGAILSNVSGSLQHIVANLPILSSEFPTQQHLGSIEPSYNFEFSLLDDQGNLEGIGKMGTMLNSMRGLLQTNARSHRPVTDGWCVSTDTFITRFLGTYQENDWLEERDGDRVLDRKVTKRTVISSSNAGTVEGNPGLSFLMFRMEETNPYEAEQLNSTAPQLVLQEANRKKILNAVLEMDFADIYSRKLLPLAITQAAGGNTKDLFADNSGASSLIIHTPGDLLQADLSKGMDAFILEEDGVRSYMVRKTGSAYEKFLDHYRVDTDGRLAAIKRQTVGSDVLAVADWNSPAETGAYYGGAAGNHLRRSQENAQSVLGLPFGKHDANKQRITDIGSNLSAQVEALGSSVVATTPVQIAYQVFADNDEYLKIPLEETGFADFGLGTEGAIHETLDPIGRRVAHFNMHSALVDDPELGSIPIDKILDYYNGILSLIATGNRLFAEEQAGGRSTSSIRDELHCLPFQNRMWQSWQIYLEEWVKDDPGLVGMLGAQESVPALLVNGLLVYDGHAALSTLRGLPGWPTPGFGTSDRLTGTSRTGHPWATPFDSYNPFDADEVTKLKRISDTYWGWFGNPSAAATGTLNVVTRLPVDAIVAVLPNGASVASNRAGRDRDAAGLVAARYMRSLPIAISMPAKIAGKYETLIANISGGTWDEKDKIPMLIGLEKDLSTNIASCGNVAAHQVNGLPWFRTGGIDNFLVDPVGAENYTSKPASTATELPGLEANAIANSFGSNGTRVGVPLDFGIANHFDKSYAGRFLNRIGAGIRDEFTNPGSINNELQYPVDLGQEATKIKYIKSLLDIMADDLLNDSHLLAAFGLESLQTLDRHTNIIGSECYPDLDLPTHPYYGDTFQTTPDFYMWNMYNDGGAMDAEDRQRIYEQVDSVVQRCHQSLTQLKDGSEWNSADDKVFSEPGVDHAIQIRTKITPEGTEGSETFFELGDDFDSKTAAFAKELKGKRETTGRQSIPDDDILAITSQKPEHWLQGVSLSATEGDYGAGSGMHYPSRISPAQYTDLKTKVDSAQNMFGSKSGHANQYLDSLNAPIVSSRIEGLDVGKPSDYKHSYSVDSLKELARDSAKDMLGQKVSLKRAYPTFKLFFVEENEFDNRFLSFDNFYSYNAVKEFTVVMSRKLPADHAVITLQNVGGTLDGTKRNTIVDLDYFDDTASDKIDAGIAEGSALSGQPNTRGTAQDQPFGAVVLRPGLNVQLRCGYSNDPDNLHVLVTGRVVDVSWNKTGDLAEIMVQSFGTELIQAIKGTRRDGGKTYQTTHALLGALMLQPEIVHFGRWEFGQLTQAGEASDSRLDFTDYSQEGFLGRFKATNYLTRSVMNHPWLVAGAAVGIGLVSSRLPVGKFLGKSSLLTRAMSKVGIGSNGILGASGLRKVITATAGAAKSAPGKGNGLGLLREAAITSTAGAYKLATKSNAAKKSIAAVRSQRVAMIKSIRAAKNFDEILEASVKFERYAQSYVTRGQWMNKPWVALAKVETWGEGIYAVGHAPVWPLAGALFGGASVVTSTVIAPGLLIDFLKYQIIDPVYSATVGNAKKFFARTEAHMFLSPQDDNLYPPHPQDYMTLERTAKDKAVQAAAIFGSRIVSEGDDLGEFLFGLYDPNAFISKKVDPAACEYTPQSSSIWEMFHEMSLRHPGWVYGPRPYGNKFEYRMFFGVPSQRYWAIPASNNFIHRMNQLHTHLGGGATASAMVLKGSEIESSFKNLYGTKVFDILEESSASGTETTLRESIDPVDQALFAQATQIHLSKTLNSIVMKEYLRGLQLRFQPFRRYHMFTSERDIIWNGIMSSEQAVTNAVDVTYWKDAEQNPNSTEGAIETQVFKAHFSTPPHMDRIAAVRWANCKTHPMAMRYGMGELMHRMRDMYRGEILVLGNPRIRPWDIGILADSYNDMVGPIEVEQVVHTFSHETGFVTEIKPSAVVFGNEMSGWPMVTAMKVFALAIKDIEDRHSGVKIEDPDNPRGAGLGFLGTLADFVSRWGAHDANFESLMTEKKNAIFGEDGESLSSVFGGTVPDFSEADEALDDVEMLLRTGATSAGGSMAFSGGAIALGGTVLNANTFYKALGNIGTSGATAKLGDAKLLLKSPKAIVGGAAIIAGTALLAGGGGLMFAADKMDFPSLVWLVGGPLMMLHCLRDEAIILVPLMKSGHPIVSGIATNDPNMIWNNFGGKLNKAIDDTLGGTGDMLGYYQRFGSAMWNRFNDEDFNEMLGGGEGAPIAAAGF